ncbi:MAG TPA: hypothetical protein VLV86_07615, partial [Vicinamibacterales bacterium]|nr:hypothetical protein [Vicinamibacterales bacterium]
MRAASAHWCRGPNKYELGTFAGSRTAALSALAMHGSPRIHQLLRRWPAHVMLRVFVETDKLAQLRIGT